MSSKTTSAGSLRRKTPLLRSDQERCRVNVLTYHIPKAPPGIRSAMGWICLIVFAPGANAGGLRVPEDYPTIQAAVDAAKPGETVAVQDGIWSGPGNTELDFRGKAITVHSANGATRCIIDCQSMTRGVSFRSGEQNGSIFRGFTIRNGRASNGAGVFIENSSPTVGDCILTRNHSDGGGSALYINRSAGAVIERCDIVNNTGLGAAVQVIRSGTFISGCRITNNVASGFFPGGLSLGACENAWVHNSVIAFNTSVTVGFTAVGGVAFTSGGTVRMTQCTVIGNSAFSESIATAGGLYCDEVTQADISGAIVWDHLQADVRGCSLTYSCIEDGAPGEGNFSLDPGFTRLGDFHLPADSPCIDAGDPDYFWRPGETDVDGDARMYLASVDVGADEFRPMMTGDGDGDSDVDLLDYRSFEVCLSASGVDEPIVFEECLSTFDLDGDWDVDLLDLLGFQNAFVADCTIRVDAGTLRTIRSGSGSYLSLGNDLSGSITQCGYEAQDLAARWHVLSQPTSSGLVSVLAPDSLRSRFLLAAPVRPGEYVFRLTGRNPVSGDSGADSVTLRVSQP